MQAAIWKNLPSLRNPLYPFPQFASIHSTPISLAKWKSKWDDKGERTSRKPSKTYIRYAVRQKRAEAKKALKDFLLYGKSSKFHVQDEDLYWCADGISSRNANVENGSFGFDSIPRSRKSGKSKPYSSSYSGKAKHGGSKRWQNGQTYYDEDDCGHPETIFEAVFGGHKGFTWSYASRENFHFNHSTSGSEWSNRTRWEKAWKRVWNDSDVYDDSTNVGSHSDRVTLGLPPTGPLKLEDVKSAYHASALKWHPDKHQGPSQAMAAEKFKHCVNAYNSLSNALKAA
ncbi:uncharacterized protein [Elaeis guineensis]|uniref:Uncharacterized protein LOC105038014 isoform X2 n=1 Tax=Elaeis guineensis var. tenera TaxID=51953 RepID=A0A6I9QQZ9_ELAGV|nr:uncharacterized protein LOC105038014 isoform X2 [Elaeis guineensis]